MYFYLATAIRRSRLVCLERDESSHYSRLAIWPLQSGQANLLGSTLRRALLGEVIGTCITSVRFLDLDRVHEYITLPGIEESVHDILLNLRSVVLRSDTREKQTGYLYFQGPGVIRAGCIQLPSSVRAIDTEQKIACVETDAQLRIELTIETGRGWDKAQRLSTEGKERALFVDPNFAPVKNVNYNILYERDESTFQELTRSDVQEILILEIWTNGSITPEEAMNEAAERLICLFETLMWL